MRCHLVGCRARSLILRIVSPPMPTPDYATAIQAHSHRVETVLKHAFLWRLYSELWRRQPNTKVLVFESEIDDSGFDVVVSVEKYTRHIQLKSSMIESSTKSTQLHQSLCRLPGGCVVWMEYLRSTLEVQKYHLFAYSNPSEPLDFSKFPLAKTTRANSRGVKKIRPGCHLVSKSAFHQNLSFDLILKLLFDIPLPKQPLATCHDAF